MPLFRQKSCLSCIGFDDVKFTVDVTEHIIIKRLPMIRCKDVVRANGTFSAGWSRSLSNGMDAIMCLGSSLKQGKTLIKREFRSIVCLVHFSLFLDSGKLATSWTACLSMMHCIVAGIILVLC